MSEAPGSRAKNCVSLEAMAIASRSVEAAARRGKRAGAHSAGKEKWSDPLTPGFPSGFPEPHHPTGGFLYPPLGSFLHSLLSSSKKKGTCFVSAAPLWRLKVITPQKGRVKMGTHNFMTKQGSWLSQDPFFLANDTQCVEGHGDSRLILNPNPIPNTKFKRGAVRA